MMNRFQLGPLRIAFFASIVLGAATTSPRSAQANEPTLIRVVTKSLKAHAGQLLSVDSGSIHFLDLATNTEITLAKEEVREFVKPFSPDSAARMVGLPPLTSWRVSLLAKQMDSLGKVAKVTPQVIYVTLGHGSGLRVGSRLTVYRNLGEIVDPDSGEVLAVERPKIAELEVVEVNSAFSKAKIAGNLEVTLAIGDEVEPQGGLRVAVCPLLNEDGSLTNIGAGLAEDITTSLVQRNLTVIERSVLDTVVGELVKQNTVLFDQQVAKKLGELAGANVVITGKIVPRGNAGMAYVRLVDVQTGEILVAASTHVNLSNATSIPTLGHSGGAASATASLPGGSSRLGAGRTLPAFLTTPSRYMRTSNKGIRIQGATEFSIQQQGAVQTRQSDFLTKDFTFEVLFDFEPGDRIAYIGLGPGLADSSYNGLKDSVHLRFHAANNGDGQVDITSFRKSSETFGHITSPGPHLVRIIKTGDSVTFQIDAGNDGPSDDDIETTIADIRQFAPFFHSKNMPLFFAGGGTYLHAALKIP